MTNSPWEDPNHSDLAWPDPHASLPAWLQPVILQMHEGPAHLLGRGDHGYKPAHLVAYCWTEGREYFRYAGANHHLAMWLWDGLYGRADIRWKDEMGTHRLPITVVEVCAECVRALLCATGLDERDYRVIITRGGAAIQMGVIW